MSSPEPTSVDVFESTIATIRRFHRFYIRQIAILQEQLIQAPFTLEELRLLYELAQSRQVSAAEIGEELGLDAASLNRIARTLELRGLLRRVSGSGRQLTLVLTPTGQAAYERLDQSANASMRTWLGHLTVAELKQLRDAAETMQRLLDPSIRTPAPQSIPSSGQGGANPPVSRPRS